MAFLTKCKACGHTKVLHPVSDAHPADIFGPCPKCGADMEIVKGERYVELPATLKTAAWPTSVAKVAEIDSDKKEMIVRISSDSLDRDKEVLLPKGMDTKHYRENPVVMYGHDYWSLPIGQSLWEKVVGQDVLARPKFSQKNEFAMQVFDLYEDETLRAWSVGFDPQQSHEPTEEEIRARPDWAGCRRIYDEWELYEYSACPVPSNPDALALAVKMGTKSIPEAILKRMELPDVGEVFDWQPAKDSEHESRVRKPEDFVEGSFRVIVREHEGREYTVVLGRLKEGPIELSAQSFRYDKDIWLVEVAQAARAFAFTPAKEVREAELFARPAKQLLITKEPTGVIRAIEIRELTVAALKGRVVVEED